MIQIKEVSTLEEAQAIRKIRNDNRHLMTNHTDYISPEQQQRWWESLDKSKISLYIVTVGLLGSIVVSDVGYGLIRFEDNIAYLSGALGYSVRGNGFGKQIFSFLIDRALEKGCAIELEVLESNTVAHSLYKKLGFKEYKRSKGVIYMKHDASV